MSRRNKSQGRKKYLRNVRSSKSSGKRGGCAGVNPSGGIKLVLITCDQGRESQCASEVVDIFREVSAALMPPKEQESENVASTTTTENTENEEKTVEKVEQPPPRKMLTVEEEMKLEFEELNQNKNNKKIADPAQDPQFIPISGPNGICLIYVKSKILDPVALVSAVFEEALKRQQALSRFSVRMIPFSRTCYSAQEDILDMAKPIITAAFADLPEKYSYAIAIKRRSNSKLDRMEIINAATEMVGPRPVNLSDPDVVVFIESFGNAAGVSVISNPGDYRKYHKFNLRAMCEAFEAPEENSTKEAPEQASISTSTTSTTLTTPSMTDDTENAPSVQISSSAASSAPSKRKRSDVDKTGGPESPKSPIPQRPKVSENPPPSETADCETENQ